MAPRIRFVRGCRGHRLATAVDGAGPFLVLPAWWVSHVERDLGDEAFRRFFEALAARYTVVRYDRAGVGLSDRERSGFAFDDEVGDLEAVLGACGIERTSLLGISCGAPLAIALAARRPALVERMTLFGGFLHGARIGRAEVQRALVALVRASWGLGSRTLCEIFLPGASEPVARRFAEEQRAGATPEMSARLLEMTYAMDVRELAGAVRAPTLVAHRKDDRAIGFELGREAAAAIPGAELLVLEGTAHLPWAGETGPLLTALGADGPAPAAPEGELAMARDGDVWTIRFRGRTAHAKHARGLADLATLVASPGRRFPAVELMHATTGEATPLAGADAILDGEARAQYRARLAALEEKLGEDRVERPEGAARLEAERDAILGELRAATGLGGRRRPLGDAAERARKAVSGRLRDTIARLARLDPALGTHLEKAIETGATCAYLP